MISRSVSTWVGPWKEGSGSISTGGSTLHDEPFSYASRFEGADGGNPEELFAAALAGCFNQALANTLGWGNFTADRIETTVELELEMGGRSPTLRGVHMTVRAKVPGIKQNQFDGLSNAAKTGCLISRLLKIDWTMDASVDAS